ncbi:MAG: DUF748 domain-containing protein [Bacteroidota bacterium]
MMVTPKLRLWHKILSALLLFIVIMLFLAPRIARKYIVNHSDTLLGRVVEIDKIRLNYFSGALKIHKLKVHELDPGSIFVSFESLRVDVDYWPLFRREVRISEITLERLYGQVEQNGDRFNFSDLTASSDTAAFEEQADDGAGLPVEAPEGGTVESPATDTTEKEGFAITLNNINLIDCDLHYADLMLDHTITLDQINLHIPGFTLNSGSTNLEVGFDFMKGGGLYSALSFHQEDSTYAVNLRLDSLNVDVIEPYIKQSLDISGISGYFSNDMHITGNLQHVAEFNLSGWNRIDALSIHDQEDRNIMSFSELNIGIDTLMMDRNQLRISEISLKDPFILFELVDTTNNWLAMMVPADTAATEEAASEAEEVTETDKSTDEEGADTGGGFDISLAYLALQNGEILFADRTLDVPFQAQVHDINIGSHDMGTGASEVQINMSAGLNQTAEILSDVIVNPQQMDDLELEFRLQHFALKDIEPYMMHYFGYPVEEGFLNFNTTNDLSGQNINSDNNIYVRQFTLGKPDKSGARIKIPLRLALGILSDREGVIDLSVPVEVAGEETSIENLGRLILKTIGQLFVKAATSPVDLLSSQFDIDPEKLKEVEFSMFKRMPGEKGMESLDLLAGILNDKPGLRIEMFYAMDREEFTDSLAYLLSVESYMEQHKELLHLFGGSVPDSTLEAYLLNELVDTGLTEGEALRDTSLDVLCDRFAAPLDLGAKYDSTRLEHADFVTDYLQAHKGVPASQFNFRYDLPDSLGYRPSHALFHVFFKSLGSGM